MKPFPLTVLIRKFSLTVMQVARCSPVASGTTQISISTQTVES